MSATQAQKPLRFKAKGRMRDFNVEFMGYMNIRCPNTISFVMYKYFVGVLLALLYSCVTFADAQERVETAQSSSASFLELYQNYSNAAYAVRWYGSAKDFTQAREKIARYQYLVLYSSKQLLTQASQPVIQFGFFKTQSEADEFVSGNKQVFPGLKTVSVSAQEHASLFNDSTDDGAAQAYFWLRPNTQKGLGSLQDLLAQAKKLYIQKQYTQALKYYAVLSLTKNEDIALMASELMAVCYERLGFSSLAAHTYAELLDKYPDSKIAARITQRLRAIETADSDDKAPLRKSKLGLTKGKAYWRGMIGQSYSNMTQSGSDIEDRDVLDVLVSHFDLHAGRDFNGHKLDARFNGYNVYDMQDEGNDSKTLIKRFYLNYSNKETGLSAVGGRQKDFDSGVYTSFDGASVRYSLGDRWSVGASAGVPVYFSDFADYIDRKFYSAFAAFDSGEHWRINSYVTQQTFFGETERSAVGGTLSYFSDDFYSTFNFDYDLEFQELNILRWSATYRFSKKSQLTASYGFQRTPFLTASNIQVGQPYLNVETYIKSSEFDYQTLLDEAFARTSLYEYGSLSFTYRVDQDLQLMTDVYHSLSSEIPRFLSDDDWETSYIEKNGEFYEYTSAGIQAVLHNLLGQQDTAVLGFRHSENTLSSSSEIRASERFGLGKKVYVKPQILLSNSKRKSEDSGKTKIRSSLALTYKPVRSAELRAEFGMEQVEDLDQKGSIDTTYFILGYQARF